MTRSLLALALLLACSCACPPQIESYRTPVDTLATYQAQLCHEDVVGEYRCLAASYQGRIGGFPTYHAVRAKFLADEAFAAWLLKHADLADRVVGTLDVAGGARVLQLDAGGEEPVAVLFEPEAWLTITWTDGTTSAARQPRPLAALLGSQGPRQWANLSHPELGPERLADVRAIEIETRWLIADLAGLAPLPAAMGSTDPGPPLAHLP